MRDNVIASERERSPASTRSGSDLESALLAALDEAGDAPAEELDRDTNGRPAKRPRNKVSSGLISRAGPFLQRVATVE